MRRREQLIEEWERISTLPKDRMPNHLPAGWGFEHARFGYVAKRRGMPPAPRPLGYVHVVLSGSSRAAVIRAAWMIHNAEIASVKKR